MIGTAILMSHLEYSRDRHMAQLKIAKQGNNSDAEKYHLGALDEIDRMIKLVDEK